MLILNIEREKNLGKPTQRKKSKYSLKKHQTLGHETQNQCKKNAKLRQA